MYVCVCMCDTEKRGVKYTHTQALTSCYSLLLHFSLYHMHYRLELLESGDTVTYECGYLGNSLKFIYMYSCLFKISVCMSDIFYCVLPKYVCITAKLPQICAKVNLISIMRAIRRFVYKMTKKGGLRTKQHRNFILHIF